MIVVCSGAAERDMVRTGQANLAAALESELGIDDPAVEGTGTAKTEAENGQLEWPQIFSVVTERIGGVLRLLVPILAHNGWRAISPHAQQVDALVRAIGMAGEPGKVGTATGAAALHSALGAAIEEVAAAIERLDVSAVDQSDIERQDLDQERKSFSAAQVESA